MFCQQESQGHGNTEGNHLSWEIRWWSWGNGKNQFVFGTCGGSELTFFYSNWRDTILLHSSRVFGSASNAQKVTTWDLAFCSKHGSSAATMTFTYSNPTLMNPVFTTFLTPDNSLGCENLIQQLIFSIQQILTSFSPIVSSWTHISRDQVLQVPLRLACGRNQGYWRNKPCASIVTVGSDVLHFADKKTLHRPAHSQEIQEMWEIQWGKRLA